MGRRENPVDRTVPARATLADFLRARRHQAQMTYQQMARRSTSVSAATFERAASGAVVPSWETVEDSSSRTSATGTSTSISHRRGPPTVDQGPPGHARPVLRSHGTRSHAAGPPADFLRALRRQHVWAGYPSPARWSAPAGPAGCPRPPRAASSPATFCRRPPAGRRLPESLPCGQSGRSGAVAGCRGPDSQDVPSRPGTSTSGSRPTSIGPKARTETVAASVSRLPAPHEGRAAA
ncbi:helix-turn-helix domain-containing protein [Streptomyces dengpaensis]